MSQQHFWNEKFEREEFFYGKKPNAFIESCKNYFDRSKKFLCLGEGEGRNAIFFAKKGFDVTALDASNIGLKKLEEFAKFEGVHVLTKCVDLNEWQPSKKYGSIVASYLHMHKDERPDLFKKIEDTLEKDGYFVGEFFSTKQLNYNSGGPKAVDFLYAVEDFTSFFENCRKVSVEEVITHLDEGLGHQGEASVIRVVLQKK
ncbi:class I SAM-dependent methyltransferase [Halarcobacter anaerophilus]|uniref:Tellurium resistance protein n=1 Tax=Halarcobacter anaerophilus TaxID=877500 RepID=A0A4Q0Y2Z4_9BACT|nr:methyltransferase domain-containing protein [Halarcobacter anaerophilus]QDF27760.1 putative tellurite resistance protein TehB [Halarcobacter anaerophilus]RXJ64103.1 tellurium resistance protein [Halarcobacter anaerophilus]